MADIWVWEIWSVEAQPGPRPAVDLTGFEVEATDGKIGKVDEATYENDRGCVVVDTGFWIFSRRRMVPAGLVAGIDPEARIVRIAATKADVKGAPDYVEDGHRDDEHREKTARHYAGLRGDPMAPVVGTGDWDPEEMSGDVIAPVAGPGRGD